jgi:hypothetical protein
MWEFLRLVSLFCEDIQVVLFSVKHTDVFDQPRERFIPYLIYTD